MLHRSTDHALCQCGCPVCGDELVKSMSATAACCRIKLSIYVRNLWNSSDPKEASVSHPQDLPRKTGSTGTAPTTEPPPAKPHETLLKPLARIRCPDHRPDIPRPHTLGRQSQPHSRRLKRKLRGGGAWYVKVSSLRFRVKMKSPRRLRVVKLSP